MILGLTPARGGSKGIPRKNIRLLCGKPLLVWTVEAALRSRCIDRYVVSTEDDEIARVAREAGAEVLDRPAELATHHADTLNVMQHAVESIRADVLVLLQPTSPIRDPDLIDSCIERFRDADADSLATGFVCKYAEYGSEDRRRQDVEGFFYDDGNVYVMRADLVRQGNRYGTRIEHVTTTKEQNVDVDDEFDFWVAEQSMNRRLAREEVERV
jgi:CMP-N,N'-diacetyllegionaminic acid synthase